MSKQLNVLQLGQSDVNNGNLLTAARRRRPAVRAARVRAVHRCDLLPTLQRVLVAFGNKIGYAATLNEALDQLFGGNSGAAAGDANVNKGGGTGGSSTEGAKGTTSTNPALAKALNDANAALKEGQAALAKGDFAAYGAAQKRLESALAAALAAEGVAGKPVPSASPSATPGATPSVTPSAKPSATP